MEHIAFNPRRPGRLNYRELSTVGPLLEALAGLSKFETQIASKPGHPSATRERGRWLTSVQEAWRRVLQAFWSTFHWNITCEWCLLQKKDQRKEHDLSVAQPLLCQLWKEIMQPRVHEVSRDLIERYCGELELFERAVMGENNTSEQWMQRERCWIQFKRAVRAFDPRRYSHYKHYRLITSVRYLLSFLDTSSRYECAREIAGWINHVQETWNQARQDLTSTFQANMVCNACMRLGYETPQTRRHDMSPATEPLHRLAEEMKQHDAHSLSREVVEKYCAELSELEKVLLGENAWSEEWRQRERCWVEFLEARVKAREKIWWSRKRKENPQKETADPSPIGVVRQPLVSNAARKSPGAGSIIHSGQGRDFATNSSSQSSASKLRTADSTSKGHGSIKRPLTTQTRPSEHNLFKI